ncbi:MAG: glycosyltransferase family 4 protein [Hyphomicrobiaceae bacterium]
MTGLRDIIHIARAPQTGVWSVIRQLSIWQRSKGHRVGIGLLIPSSWPKAARDQLEDLRSNGIHIITASSPDIFGTGALLYHQLKNPISSWLDNFANVQSETIIHFHNAWLAGAYLPLRTVKPSSAVVTYHGIAGASALRTQPIRRLIHRYWAQRLNAAGVKHASVDAENPKIAKELFDIETDIFTVVANGYCAIPGASSSPPWLQDQSRTFTVGQVSVIDDGKGWQITAMAVKYLRNNGHNVRLLLAGTGPQAQKAADWCHAHSSFAKYLGYVENPQIDVYPQLDVLALPSLTEGLPMAAIEALAFSIPVVATPVGGLAQAITNGANGYLVGRTVSSISTSIRKMISDPAGYGRLSKGARESHRRYYSVDVMGRAYDELYDATTVLAGKRH